MCIRDRDTGIFSDRETETLEQNGLELTHSGARTAFEEQYLIYMGITKPSDYLYLCRSVRDGSGRETRPSPLITKIENMFSNVEKKMCIRDSPYRDVIRR